MSSHNEGLGSSTESNVPNKRKRGRPRKEKSGVRGSNVTATASSTSVSSSSETAQTADGYEGQMVGKVVYGVIEGTFDAGYLVKVQLEDTYLRGAVFLPERIVPVTAENCVALDLPMIKTKNMPIPALNPESCAHSSFHSSTQYSMKSFGPEPLRPVPIRSQLPPSELYSDISISLENQFASAVVLMADSPTIDSPISTGGHVIESISDGGATEESEITSEVFNLVPTVENTKKEHRIGLQSAHFADELVDELIIRELRTRLQSLPTMPGLNE
ncbi:hypothetical protein TanjilG_09337 [Lupinus angustifolius]|uniref:Uncharacterized protein n=1 Tax=Lupinus angustifolius TaxID=3871 RepID=A0A4P1RM74_LUPAN|nr:PREDICTED: uncharacterized protein LOC109345327 [Lupinus angustifolius]XP_019439803.1 PREDICTED: uncharacterized protein LOC109345327 [Lupinus angustifolius]XP_019439805.1 PREDICTED: uncharacterized protein LOC109345327 [Lupinus angustifolius]XP_019439806.1 PREDICTED: uncharacterized protein LOC109345327 [Lupinus angustifolius]XP_019439807.1 PREDICTED: uncharacterized protein LOC109345327 [Lupinus angustifolius]XP_019439808.1 PREDICTED: uncharacterized protein LOC109345327 [Lupinus angustif